MLRRRRSIGALEKLEASARIFVIDSAARGLTVSACSTSCITSRMASHTWAWLYYASFVLLAVFVVVNLFIAVVLSNLDEARRELEGPRPATTIDDVLAELRRLRAEVHAQRPRGAPGGPA